jgi:intein/homing endonuclease
MSLTPEKAEILGALFGDKSLFGFYPRYGKYKGYDYSRYKQGIVRISVGKDADWGEHLSALTLKAYNIHGCVVKDTREWVFRIDSARVVWDLMNWYGSLWDCYTWRVHPQLFESSNEVKASLIRGYCDADGSPIYNKSRKQPLIKIESVNYKGLQEINSVFQQLSYDSHLWKESKTRGTWGVYLTKRSDIERYFREIGFGVKRKQLRIAEILNQRIGCQ